MFSGFDNFAEGFKRFSLDALQDQEEQEDGTTLEQRIMPVVPAEQPNVSVETPPQKLPSLKEEHNEWDWDQENTSTAVDRQGVSKVGASQQRHETHLERPPKPASTASVGLIDGGVAVPSLAAASHAELEQIALHENHWRTGGALGEPGGPEREVANNKAEERRERKGLAANNDPLSVQVNTALQASKYCSICGRPTEDEAEDVNAETTSATHPSSPGKPPNCLGCRKAATVASNVDMAMDGGAAAVVANGKSAAGSAGTRGGCESPKHLNGHGEYEVQRQRAGSSAQESLEATVVGVGVGVARVEPARETAADSQTLKTMRQELDLVKNAASGLEGALQESRSEVQHLREMLATEEDTTRKQAGKLASLSDEVNATRMGFRESNAAHQRTAERSHALEEELHNTRKVADTLRAESAALEGQVKEASDNRQTLEGQLRHLQAGLTEGQEAARQEGRQEVERLEARLKDFLKDRDRKQAELDLQNARRKETREMARDLESQLAAVERIAQEREVELNTLKDEMLALRKNTGEATDQKNTWATKYEALEHNFKQVRAQSKRAESELEEVRQNTARIETEKAVLEERVEVEGAERVTVVASVSHERDFLLRQVDRLEQELTELRRSQEAQAAAVAARAQTTGVLEEYRTRTQQALKRANEITSQTASENTRLEAEMDKLSAEVAQQRPLWEQSKQLEEVHHAEVAKLKELLARKATELNDTAAATAALDERLAEEEEERRNAHTSVMRLEAQGKSLKQELQRQQKALAAAQENSATLQTKLADQEAALQAVENRQSGKSSHEAEINADMGKYPPSPLPAVPSLSLGWEEEKHASRQSTPRGTEAAGATWADRRRSLGESFSSVPSEGDSTDAAQGGVGEQLFYVHQLRERMSKEQIEMRSLISELEASRTAADAQAAKQTQLEKQLEAALLDKKRLQDLDSGRNAAINLTYLKNCVVGCLRTSEPSEHARLLPVITAILKLSEEESAAIAKNISTRAQHQGSFGGSLPQAGAGGDAGSGGANSSGSRSWWSANPQKK